MPPSHPHALAIAAALALFAPACRPDSTGLPALVASLPDAAAPVETAAPSRDALALDCPADAQIAPPDASPPDLVVADVLRGDAPVPAPAPKDAALSDVSPRDASPPDVRLADASPPDPDPVVGCADGTREGFLDRARHPRIAACAGGWTVPGLVAGETLVPQCGRRGGDDGARPTGTGCSAADLCAPGWAVCASAQEVASRAGSCADALPPGAPEAFYATRQRATDALCDGLGLNNVHGCGTVPGPAEDASCAPFTRRLGILECRDFPPWACGDPAVELRNELAVVVKPGPERGGVLCCR